MLLKRELLPEKRPEDTGASLGLFYYSLDPNCPPENKGAPYFLSLLKSPDEVGYEGLLSAFGAPNNPPLLNAGAVVVLLPSSLC